MSELYRPTLYTFSMTDYALKEWDSQVQALVRGDTALILRKGGIIETRDQFELEHRSFWLYPTFLHQNPLELREEFRGNLRPQPQFGQVCIPAYAEVLKVWKVESLEQALTLEPYQPLTQSSIKARFKYRNKPWIHALLLRVFPLEQPLCMAETEGYLGCISWVPLGQSLPMPEKSVLEDGVLSALERELSALLG